jgi:hypothetical protein
MLGPHMSKKDQEKNDFRTVIRTWIEEGEVKAA